MGLFKKFKAPKGKIELKLNEVSYEAADKLTGKILLDPDEDVSVDEFRIEFSGKKKIRWRKGVSSYNATSSGDIENYIRGFINERIINEFGNFDTFTVVKNVDVTTDKVALKIGDEAARIGLKIIDCVFEGVKIP